MPTKKTENIVEAEVVEETKDVCCAEYRKPRAGFFFGTILLVWGGSIILDTYFHTSLTENIWPLLAVVFGVYLVFSSFNR